MLKRAITYEEAERVAFAKSVVVDQGTLLPSADTKQYSLACWIYLAASAAATLGWLWFLVKTALGLLSTVWGFLQNM